MEQVAVFLGPRMIKTSQNVWVTRMAHTYEEAYLEAFDEFADALFRHASLRVSSRDKAADLTQETFMKAWDYARGGGEVRHWKSFLYRVLNNLIIDEYRKQKEESLDAMLEDDTSGGGDMLATGSREEKELSLNDELLMERIQKFMPRLPDNYRVAITLRYIDGFSPKEIAHMLDLSENVVSVRLHRAIARLKELVGPEN